MMGLRMREPTFTVTLKDCDVQTFRAGGPGGQNQNKRDTAVRITHRASGAVGESRDQRTQWANKMQAFNRMAQSKTFTSWVSARLGGIDRIVDEQMRPENLLVEVGT